jgi:Holliday junction resolvase RusA-like endonuclease
VNSISFTVPGPPVAKARARVVLNCGKVRAFTPAKTASYENLVRMAFADKYPGFIPREGAVRLTIHAAFQITAEAKKSHALLVTKRPDIDNCAKSVMDALNGLAWRDDAQVTDLTVYKRYGLAPAVHVEIDYVSSPPPSDGESQSHK